MFNYYDKDFDETPSDILYLNCFVQYLCVFAAFTWLVYEYCITLDKEVEFFWGRRPNGGSLLFFVNRYLPLLVRAVDISGYTVMNEPDELIIVSVSCYKLAIAFQVADSLQYLPCAVFAGVRAWVLGGRKWALTAFVMMLSLVPVGLEYVPSIEVRVHPSFGCATGLTSVTSSEEERLVIASRVCLITSDAIVLVVTWFATYNMGMLRRSSRWKYTSFWKTLFRDGTIHFCTLVMLNILYLVFSLRTIKSPNLNPSCYVVVFIGPAATILVNRFLIHVREVNKHMIQGLDRSEDDVSMQSNDRSLELRFVKTFPQDRPTIIITHTSNLHANDFVQPMDSTISETTAEAHV